MLSFLKQMLASMIGFILAIGFVILIMVIVVVSLVPKSDEEVELEKPSILVLKFDKPIVDKAIENPFGDLDIKGFEQYQQIGLNQLLENIKKAETDKNIPGIYIEMPFMLQTGMASVEELRNALLNFKKSGKFIAVYAEMLTHKTYLLASVADYIWLNPKGNFFFQGLNTEVLFFKGTFEKLGIEPILIRHGKFKGAGEPLIRENLSDENRHQISSLLENQWSYIINNISVSRNINKPTLQGLANRLDLVSGDSCKKYNIVDELFYKDQVIQQLAILTGDSAREPRMINFSKYRKVPPIDLSKKFSKPKIAVIYAEGQINMGADREDISSDLLSKEIRKARKDSTIQAIVLRINSPGGSALASDIIWREVKLARETKPLVVSMGSIAASGGYYIACAADTIVADSTTITGSIGVFGVLFNAQKFLNNKLGITTDVVGTNDNSGFPSITRSMTKYEELVLQREIDRVYDDFISVVAEGRGLSKNKVDELAQGRVWSAIDAQKAGLVDVLGGLDTATHIAARMAKLDEFRIVELPKSRDPFDEIFDITKERIKLWGIKSELGAGFPIYQQYQKAVGQTGIRLQMPFELTEQ